VSPGDLPVILLITSLVLLTTAMAGPTHDIRVPRNRAVAGCGRGESGHAEKLYGAPISDAVDANLLGSGNFPTGRS
jgi:hypothetical protein